MKTTKSQEWARNISKGLQSSYDSLALIEHKVTSGSGREKQIFDILKYLLPKRFALETNVVIINSEGTETKKFDGAIIDSNNWPMLFADGNLVVSPIESIKIAFEVKSNLVTAELVKIFEEAENIRAASSQSAELSPKVAGFAYRCSNIKLIYYDFVVNFLKNSNYPSFICILNVGILCFLKGDSTIAKTPDTSCTPVFLETGEDSLLAFTYFLTEHLAEGHVVDTTRRYSKHIYENMPFFCFDESFIKLMKVRSDYRKHFEGKPDTSLKDTYEIVKALF